MHRDYKQMAARAADLPDDSLVLDRAAALLLGIHVDTLRRLNLVPAVEITPRTRGRRLGDIRAFIRRRGHAGDAATA